MASRIDVELTIDDILMSLPRLSREDIRKVGLTCKMLTRGGKPSNMRSRTKKAVPTRDEEEMELFFEVFYRKLSDLGVNCPPYVRFVETQSFSDFRKGWVIVDAFLSKHFTGNNLRRPNRMKMYSLFAEMLVNDVVQAGRAMTMGMLSKSVQRVPALILQQFPGYVQQGLLHILLESKYYPAGIDDEG